MLDTNIVINTMNNRGFTKISYGMQNNQIVNISFAINENNIAIGCVVDLVKEEFEIVYPVPKSINQLKTPKCSAFMDDNHFNKMYSKIKEQAIVLNRFYGD